MMQLRFVAGLGILFSASIAFQGCDPGYWFGVRANLKEPLSPECIESTLRKLPVIERVIVYKPESRDAVKQSPDQYIFEAGDDKGTITQFQKEEGRTSFVAGVNGMGPSQEHMENMQVFNARIAIQVAQACHARFSDGTSFLCTPDRVHCREVVQSQKAR